MFDGEEVSSSRRARWYLDFVGLVGAKRIVLFSHVSPADAGFEYHPDGSQIEPNGGLCVFHLLHPFHPILHLVHIHIIPILRVIHTTTDEAIPCIPIRLCRACLFSCDDFIPQSNKGVDMCGHIHIIIAVGRDLSSKHCPYVVDGFEGALIEHIPDDVCILIE